MYTGLPHKVLLPEKFNEEVAKLRTRYIFSFGELYGTLIIL
jgi:hypothetical protein